MYYRYSINLVILCIICGVSNEETPKPTNQLLAGSSPRVTMPSEIVNTKIGFEAVLECHIDGDNITKIYWMKSAADLSNNTEYDIQTSPLGKDSATTKIRVEIVDYHHDGNYNCYAENKNGKTGKSTVRLTVVDAEMSPPAVVPATITPVTDQDQHPTQDNNYEEILWKFVGGAVVFVPPAFIFLVAFYVLKKGCCFTPSCFSNGLRKLIGTLGKPDNKEVLGKDERAGSDETHRKDGSANGGSDHEAELNGVEVQPPRMVNQKL